jgi:hypothetical protein
LRTKWPWSKAEPWAPRVMFRWLSPIKPKLTEASLILLRKAISLNAHWKCSLNRHYIVWNGRGIFLGRPSPWNPKLWPKSWKESMSMLQLLRSRVFIGNLCICWNRSLQTSMMQSQWQPSSSTSSTEMI